MLQQLPHQTKTLSTSPFWAPISPFKGSHSSGAARLYPVLSSTSSLSSSNDSLGTSSPLVASIERFVTSLTTPSQFSLSTSQWYPADSAYLTCTFASCLRMLSSGVRSPLYFASSLPFPWWLCFVEGSLTLALLLVSLCPSASQILMQVILLNSDLP